VQAAPIGSPALDALKAVWLVPAAERKLDAPRRGCPSATRQFPRHAGGAPPATPRWPVHWDVTERIRIVRRLDFTRADRIDATYNEHAKILRAVIQRKADQAQLLLKSHIGQSKSEVRKITLHTTRRSRGCRCCAAR
jgi:hypothetical protein